MSWSRYLGQLGPWLSKNLDPNWTRNVNQLYALLQQGDSINQMMQVTGEDGGDIRSVVRVELVALT